MKRLRNFGIAALIAVSAIAFGRGWEQWGTSAAPITCPNGQFAEHDTTADGGWSCENNGGNESDAAKTKNPNTK